MLPIRTYTRTLSLALGFVFVAGPLAALQPPKDDLPKESREYRRVSELKNARGIPANELKAAQEAFKDFARFFAEYVAHPRVYSATQEFVPPVTVRTVDQLITEVNRHILVPSPPTSGTGVPQVGFDQADYIRELGAALDAALKPVILDNGERIVRVNATRLLAAACRSGATAHYPTVTALIRNANTPPEVRYYAFQAAANLLAAYDLTDYRTRRHSSSNPKDVSDLIAAIQDCILKPALLVNLPAESTLPADQRAVAAFIRRHAVKALAQVRYADKVPNGPDLYPAFTLARIAVSDPGINPPPGEAEIAEAVLGICNMTPPLKPPAATEAYAFAMSDAVATGIVSFAGRRGGSATDKSLPWRGYAAQLREAMKNWKPLFDVGFNPQRPTSFLAASVPKVVNDLVTEAERRVLTPMDGAGPVDVNGLRQFRDNTIRSDKKWTLTPFPANPKLTLPKKE